MSIEDVIEMLRSLPDFAHPEADSAVHTLMRRGGWPLQYTISLDAALSLVPKGMRWAVDSENCAGVDDGESDNGPEMLSEGENPAISLCIAALRASVNGTSSTLGLFKGE